MSTFMLAFLIVASLAGVSAFHVSGLCVVDGNYTGVDNTSWPQVQNLNFGTFLATAYDNDTNTVTTTYHANETLKITIASNGTDKIAGIVGYFANSMQLPGEVLRVGNWLLLDNENYTSTRDCPGAAACSHGPCKPDVFTVFSDVNDSRQFFDGVSQSELSLEWNFDYFDLNGLMHLKTAHSYVFEMSSSYSGTVYWILVPDRIREEAEAQYPTAQQLKDGLKADGRRAHKSGHQEFYDFMLSDDNFVVAGLETNTIYTVYYFAEITNPPKVHFEAYVLTGELGDNSTQQLYRTVARDPVNLILEPASDPLPTAVQMMQLQTDRSAAFAAGPTMLLIALCLWISSSQMLL